MKRPMVPILAVVGVIVIGMLAIGFWSTSRPASAERVAEQYLEALSGGDAADVRALLADPDAVPESAWTAFEGAAEHLGDAEIVELSETEDAADVRVETVLADEPLELRFALAKDGTAWRVAEPTLTPVTMTATRGAWIDVAGSPMPLEGGSAELSLLPASYDVSAWPADFLDGQDRVRVGAEPASVELDPAFTDAAQTQAEDALDAHIDECLAASSEVLDGCGMTVPWPADLAEATEITYRADALPQPEIDLDAGTFQATGGVVVATVTGLHDDGSEGTYSYRTDSWNIYGSVSLDEEGLLLSVN